MIRLFEHIFLQNYSAFSPIKHTTLTFFGFKVFVAIKGRRYINMNKYQSVTLVFYLPLGKKNPAVYVINSILLHSSVKL